MRVFIIYLFCIMTSGLLAQELSIELSIDWKKTEVQFDIPPMKPDTVVSIPYFKITYRNLARHNIYFKKLYSSKSYPPVISASLICTSMDMAERAKLQNNYDGVSHIVEIGDGWITYTEDTYAIYKSGEEHEFDIINDGLFEVYAALETQESLNELGLQKQLSCFKYPDKTVVSYREAQSLIFDEKEKRGLAKSQEYHFPDGSLKEEEILKEYSDQFVLLNPREAYEQEVNLIGFYLLGGSYEFTIPNHSLPSNVLGKDRRKIQLPKVVNGYQLYEGAFLTNTVTIEFD